MSRPLPFLLLSAVACGASADVQVLVPEDVELHWDEAFNGVDDGLGALVPVDVMVYDAASGDPIDGVALAIVADGEAVQLLPADGANAIDPLACGGCDPVWDAWRDVYVDIVSEDASWVTGDDGVLRLYVFVDAFSGDDAFLPVQVSVALDGAASSFRLLPR